MVIVNNQTPVSGTIRKDAGIPGCKGNNCNDCHDGNCATVPPCVDDRNTGKEFTTVAETTVHEEATTAFVTTEKQITTETATTGATTGATQKITTQTPTTAKIETFPMTTETDGSGSMSAAPMLPNPLVKPGQSGKKGNRNTGVQTSFVESRSERKLRNQIRRLQNRLKRQNQQRNRKSIENKKSTLLYGNFDNSDCGSTPGACKNKMAEQNDHDLINGAWESDDF